MATETEAPTPVALTLTAAELRELRTTTEIQLRAATNAHLYVAEDRMAYWRAREAFLGALLAKLRAAEGGMAR